MRGHGPAHRPYPYPAQAQSIADLPARLGLFRVYFMQPRQFSAALLAGTLSFSALANEATVTMACQSIAVFSASADDSIGSTYLAAFTADFNDQSEIASINNEWFAYSGTSNYATLLQLEDTFFEVGFTAFLEVDIPLPGDSNLNFITDFFEVDRAIDAQTAGSADFGDGPQPVSAVWSRAAGKNTGQVRLSLATPSALGDELVFEHTFEIFQYSGKFTYTAASALGGDVSGNLDLTRVGGEGKLVGGFPLILTDARSLERRPTQWTGSDQVNYEILGTHEVEEVELFLDRIATRPWYAGSFFFLDGMPGTPFQDEFDLWDIFISDPNDGDGDGIPDLTDPPTIIPSEPPSLVLSASQGSLQFTISGTAGTVVNLEQRPALSTGNWTVLQAVTLAGASETVVLNSPSENSFYQVTIP